MDKKEFIKEIKEYAEAYAMDCIVDINEHPDAAEAVKYDYIEGAIKAFEIIYKTTWNNEK